LDLKKIILEISSSQEKIFLLFAFTMRGAIVGTIFLLLLNWHSKI